MRVAVSIALCTTCPPEYLPMRGTHKLQCALNSAVPSAKMIGNLQLALVGMGQTVFVVRHPLFGLQCDRTGTTRAVRLTGAWRAKIRNVS